MAFAPPRARRCNPNNFSQTRTRLPPFFFVCFLCAAEANIAATNPSVSEAAAAAATGVTSDEALPVV